MHCGSPAIKAFDGQRFENHAGRKRQNLFSASMPSSFADRVAGFLRRPHARFAGSGIGDALC